MQKHARPLSPHLQIYKPQLTSVLSILHRFTGLLLFTGQLAFSLWLFTLAQGPKSYQMFINTLSHPLAQGCFFLFLFSFLYHLCNGIRHLFWDIGWGYSLSTVYKSGWSVVVISLFSTLLLWIYLQ